MQTATNWWSPKLSPWIVRLMKGFRSRKQLRDERLLDVTVQGAEKVRRLIADNHAVLITPNHPTHADAYSIYAASDAVQAPFYMMAAWQVFADKSWFGRWALRWHGCFSVDREATDMRAFRQAVAVLEKQPQPLVIFPEGEVYHCNARVRPFREGAAAIALTAAKRAKRPIVCVPCALWYQYADDPHDELVQLMGELEKEMFWRPRPDLPLHERIYRLAEVILVIKELEFLGRAGSGPLPERIAALAEKILRDIEARYEIPEQTGEIPERVKELRHRAIEGLEQENITGTDRKRFREELENLFLVVQLYSYPGDYVSEQPTIERMAETLDKLEEDVLDRFSATVRGHRRCTVSFGDPIPVEKPAKRREAMRQLTESLEQGVQQLIDELSNSTRA